MNRKRREVLKTGGGAGLLALLAAAGWVKPETALAQAWNKAAFESHSMAETMKELGGGEPAQSKDIVFFQTPEIAENGAVGPIGVSRRIAEPESVATLVAKH